MPPHVDIPAAIAELGGMRGLYAEAAALFLADAPRQLDALRRALDTGDRGTARRAAHTLKSMAAALGAQRLTMLAQELELGCRDDAGARPDAAACETELAAVCAEMQRFLAT